MNSLTDELVACILSFVDDREVLKLIRICKKFFRASRHMKLFGKHVLLVQSVTKRKRSSEWEESYTISYNGIEEKDEVSWRNVGSLIKRFKVCTPVIITRCSPFLELWCKARDEALDRKSEPWLFKEKYRRPVPPYNCSHPYYS